ncbi:MAG: hypothetical protein OER86_04670, partial [Phycisphaerae bacterium]|nr:hypothetical protein [Phycisphaerae bacterium]
DPTDNGLRALVVSEGASLSDFVRSLRKEMGDLRTQVDNSLRTTVDVADSLVDRVAELNREIVVSEAGQGGANSLRDERDRVLDELATYLDIQTIEQPGGGVNVLVNSVPLVLGTESRGLAVEFEAVGDELEIRLRVPADGSSLTPTGGRIGALLSARSGDVDAAIEALDTFTIQFVNQVNRLHASGQSGRGFDDLASDNFALDPTLALNDSNAGLPFIVNNGTLQFHVTQLSSDTRSSTQIHIDLDGIGADTTLNDVAAALDAVANVSASVTPGGRLQISADSPDFVFSFSDDSSGVLAAMGVNTFFSGDQATNMAVNPLLLNDPTRVATAQNHVSGDNRTALAIADLGQASVPGLNGVTLREFWARHVEDFAIRTAQTRQQAAASDVIVGGLETQRAGISGVSLDEEAINMLTYEKAYQAAARFITVIDELTDTLLGLVR